MSRRTSVTSYVIALSMAILLVMSCSKPQSGKTLLRAEQSDSLMEASYQARNYQRLLVLADSLNDVGLLSDVKANYWRGYAYSRLRRMRAAEFYWSRVTDGEVSKEEDRTYYYKSANRLASLLLLKGDYEGTLKVAMSALTKMETAGHDSISDYANLLTSVGCCQLKLSRPGEAAASFQRAWDEYMKRIDAAPSVDTYTSAIIGMITTTDNCLSTKHFEEARTWTERFEELLNRYEARSWSNKSFIDKQRTRLHFYRARAMEGLGNSAEAAKDYEQALKTQYAKTGDGRIEAADYLMAAQRWKEAANNYGVLDEQIQKYGMAMSLDIIQRYYLPKYRANVGANRRDTVLAIGAQICNALDSAIARQKSDDAAELATVYDTQEKEAQIARQQADMSRQQMVSVLVILGLFIMALFVYVLLKRQSAHRMAVAHAKLEDAHGKLQQAYDQLETTTKAKERIESELRIARDIQDSMVPRVFPQLDALDIYGSMTPAREVGGDLYDYLLQDDQLYFCVGDVSGKGVPASLFMAQAIRLFRSIAKQHHTPATIATRINNELTEDNEQGMFVTMFIGLIDLKTGRMDYCNAGHNPPVLGFDEHDEFMTMESNAPIGLWPDLEFVGETIDDVRNHLLLIYTDGLNEAENPKQEQFGDDRLLDILSHRHFDSSRELIDYLNAEVVRHRAGAEPNDDLTMLCLFVK